VHGRHISCLNPALAVLQHSSARPLLEWKISLARPTSVKLCSDERERRVGTGKSLKMFLARVLLGRAYVSRQPRQFRKPPCTTCYTDDCVDSHHRSCFDSVVATHRDAGATRLLFREFVVYDLAQSYPEFLIKYERR